MKRALTSQFDEAQRVRLSLMGLCVGACDNDPEVREECRRELCSAFVLCGLLNEMDGLVRGAGPRGETFLGKG